MSLVELITFYLLNLAFWLWVARWGGAEWLEGTFLSGFLVSIWAPRWSAEGIKTICLRHPLFQHGSFRSQLFSFLISACLSENTPCIGFKSPINNSWFAHPAILSFHW